MPTMDLKITLIPKRADAMVFWFMTGDNYWVEMNKLCKIPNKYRMVDMNIVLAMRASRKRTRLAA